MEFSTAQIERLSTLGCKFDASASFETADERNAAFKDLEKRVVKANRAALRQMQADAAPSAVNEVARSMASFLSGCGFMEVSTPIIISKQFLECMTIDDDHALHEQVFWVGDKSCLRPMLAPGLYDVSHRLMGALGKPLSVFEIGPCFRKESKGQRHLESFTMCNFVEWGIPEDQKERRLRMLIALIMDHLGLEYELVEEDSVVYGKTIDIEVDGLEIASGAFGPHPLDAAWGYEGTWLGLGLGLERIVCLQRGIPSVQRVGRNLVYHNGVALNFK